MTREMSANPWVERFHPLLDPASIRRLAIVRPKQLVGLRALPKESASGLLRRAMEAAYYPTSQGVTLLQRWLGIACAHSEANYSGHDDYYGRLHEEDVEFCRVTSPMCLTGLAGVGKTALISAATRIMPPTLKLAAKEGMFVPLESCRVLRMEVCTNPNDLLRKFSGGSGSGDNLKRISRRFAFRNGISLVVADEFQFASLSSAAGTQVTKMLLSMDAVGLPFVYGANFSMLHTLKKRNQQERQRLFADITELHPDSVNGEDWINTLVILRDVAPEIFVFNPVDDAVAIHAMCFGIKRALALLLKIAYSAVHENGAVGVEEIFRAYKSRDYASYREDLLALQGMTTEVRRARTDLWNPLSPVDELRERERQNFEQRELQVANASMLAAMNKDERKAHAAAAREKPVGVSGSKGGRNKKQALTADDLTRNSLLFRDSVKAR